MKGKRLGESKNNKYLYSSELRCSAMDEGVVVLGVGYLGTRARGCLRKLGLKVVGHETDGS